MTRSIVVRALIDNSDGQLKPGLLMSVELLKNERDALRVPEEALISPLLLTLRNWEMEMSPLVAVTLPEFVQLDVADLQRTCQEDSGHEQSDDHKDHAGIKEEPARSVEQ